MAKNGKLSPVRRKKLNANLWVVTSILLGLFVFTRFFSIKVYPRKQLGLGRGSEKVAGLTAVDEGLSGEEKKAVLSFLKFKKIKSEAIPSGIPKVYGKELAVSFDQVQESMNKMRVFGPTYGEEGKKIVLGGNGLSRYIKIGEQTSCEFCCGAKTLVKEDGEAACGCAHSIVMRGLTAYLIKNHSDKFSDDEILAEINEWKKVFFPKQTLAARFNELKEAGDEDIESLLQEFPDFLPQMVGGC